MAVRLMQDSKLTIQDESEFDPTSSVIGALHVWNNNTYLGKEYYGVLLESMSMFTGAANTRFTTLNAKGDQVDMPSENQITVSEDSGGTVVQ